MYLSFSDLFSLDTEYGSSLQRSLRHQTFPIPKAGVCGFSFCHLENNSGWVPQHPTVAVSPGHERHLLSLLKPSYTILIALGEQEVPLPYSVVV